MQELKFVKTLDGSIGLYNEKIKDIYHSKYGAFTESYEKFILPSTIANLVQTNSKIKILDICYGIGYNTKQAINCIYSNNKKAIVEITAIEKERNLIFLSGLLKNTKFSEDIENIILTKIMNQFDNFDLFLNFINKNRYISNFLDKRRFILLKKLKSDNSETPRTNLKRFLHNIYYHYISSSYNRTLKHCGVNDLSLSCICKDARDWLKAQNNKELYYDFIFLDAFSPNISPQLWTLDFFKYLYDILSNNGILTTYSSAVPIRSALIQAGFCVGKTVDNSGKSIGTIATKSSSNIKIPLNKYELGLIQTKAGICYRDITLSDNDDIILKNRLNEIENSNRMSTTSYKKQYGDE